MDDFYRRLAARRELWSEAYDLVCDIAELEGGLSEVERTQERADIFRWVWSHPRYDHAASDRIFYGVSHLTNR